MLITENSNANKLKTIKWYTHFIYVLCIYNILCNTYICIYTQYVFCMYCELYFILYMYYVYIHILIYVGMCVYYNTSYLLYI